MVEGSAIAFLYLLRILFRSLLRSLLRLLPFFLKSILCDVKMRSVAVSHRVTTRKCADKATTLVDCSLPWKLKVPELAQKTLLLVKNGHLLRKTTAILFSLRASWIECENKILFIPKWQRISFLWQILRPGRRTNKIWFKFGGDFPNLKWEWCVDHTTLKITLKANETVRKVGQKTEAVIALFLFLTGNMSSVQWIPLLEVLGWFARICRNRKQGE